MSSTRSTSHPSTQRPSRFVEGEPVTQSPPSTTSPLLASILFEQDESESRLRSSSRPRQGSGSSAGSSRSQHATAKEISRRAQSLQTQPINSGGVSDPMGWKGMINSSSGLPTRGRGSLEEGRQKLETTREKFVGRLRALTTGHSLEHKIQTGKAVLYPGT